MTLWTIQVPEFYNQLMKLGYAYCPGIDDFTREYMLYPYNWMAGQMRKRIGEPPLPEIEYPVWAWYQYMGGAQKKPSKVKSALSCGTSEHGYEMLLELNVPDDEVLLSDFDMWHIPLNHSDYLVRPRSRRFMRRVKRYSRDRFSEYPPDLKEIIYRSWERIFDLRPNHKSSYTKYIQATLWWVKKEWLVSAEKLVYTELVDDTIYLPDGVTQICDDAFGDCASLSNVRIPDTVTHIGEMAFGRCPSLQQIYIPDSVTSIGSEAFSECTSLRQVRLPAGPVDIDEMAFYNCPVKIET